MGSLIAQLENKIIADSVPTNLSITDSHGSRAVIPCTLVDSSKGTDVAFLDYISSTSRKRISIVLKLHGSDAVKSKSGKGEPDFHGFQVEILKDHKGETLKALESNTCLNDDSTASDRVLDGTRLVAKYIGSEPRLYLESGKGETFKSSELGILESECSYSTARGLCSTRLVAKFTGKGEPDSHGSQAAILKEAISNAGKGQADFHGAQAAILLKEEISTDCKDSGWADSESNTHQDDGTTASKTTTTDSGWADSESSQEGKGETCERTDVCSPDPESNTLQDDGSTASAAVLGGEFNCLTTTEGETCPRTDVPSLDSESTLQEDADSGVSQEGVSSQKIKIGIAGSENNTHLDDGSTSTDKGFMVSEKNTCHVDLSTTADGIVNEAISKDYEGDSHDPQPEISQEVILEARKEKMFTVASSCDSSDAVKPNAGKGITISVPDYFGSKILISNDGKGTRIIIPDYHRSKVVISTDGKDEPDPHARIFTELISNDCKGGNTYRHLERNSDVRYYCERDTFGPTKKEAISLLDDLSVTGKVQGSSMESLPSDIVQESVPVEGSKTPQRTDVPSPDSESIIPQEDVSSQKAKIGIADSESNTHLDDGSTWTDKGFMVSENNTCHVDLSTTADGIVNEAISKDWEVQGSTMESLPSDIVQEILSRVPAESVLECKLVCKKWVTVIRGRNFANMHLTHQLKHLHEDDSNNNLAAKVEPSLLFACRINDPIIYKTLLFHGGQVSDEKYVYNQNLKRIYHAPMHEKAMYLHLVGSCNGLVCAFQYHHLVLDPVYVFNPLTREYVHLPELLVKKEDVHPDLIEEEPNIIREGEVDMCSRIACGFGYVRSTNEYKVVRIHYLSDEEGNVEVYTLGSGCGWRAIGSVPYEMGTISGGVGTYANDAIYWTSYNFVVAFDLANEEFWLPPVPSCMHNRRPDDICKFVVLGSHLCLYMDDELRVQIWSLKNTIDLEETWCKEFDINYEAIVGSHNRMLQPILLTMNGEILCLYAESVLYTYDTKTAILKMISNEASADSFDAVAAIAHVNTFASMEALGEKSRRCTVRPWGDNAASEDVDDVFDQSALGEEIDTTLFRMGKSAQ